VIKALCAEKRLLKSDSVSVDKSNQIYLEETRMNTNAVCWFEIYVDDMPRAKAFYESVLNQELTRLDNPDKQNDFPQLEMWAFPMEERPGASGAICKMEGVAAGGNSTLVYFDSEDCSVEEARVAKAGGKLVVPKMAVGEYGFISIAQDTEGNTIGFHSMK
jgi:predicted enzyme related to lactoylglutathione lyase